MEKRDITSVNLTKEELTIIENNQKEIEKELKLDEVVFYDGIGNEITVVSLYEKKMPDLIVGRGVSVMSFKESPNRQKGRIIARKRALRAFRNKKDDLPIHTQWRANLNIAFAFDKYLFKSAYYPRMIKEELKEIQYSMNGGNNGNKN